MTLMQQLGLSPEDLTRRLANSRVLVVGDVMLDRYWFGDVSRISPEAPVPVAKIARMEERAGGEEKAHAGESGVLDVVGELPQHVAEEPLRPALLDGRV
jgi:hypothetical protein